ncbi:branched-chain-amino-acid transaminase bat2 [Dispira parvispora]|uniref:Branched-chain-amino-acid aminotransferase n=1 Tax=Dispira parvispora TaxID=1520584 RepID=A0A9W8ARX7_9FUNG|nr:branched-chain-amino-acid transaminase bat2 [Dispira parvispora]
MTISQPTYRPANPAVAPIEEHAVDEPTQLHPLKASLLQKTLSSNLKPLIPNHELVFGKSFSDHMLLTAWDSKYGWHAPEIKPYGPLELEPSSVVFHYAFTCFEGMKAYKDKQGRIRLFRPDMNMKRMNHSAARLALPTFDGNEYIKCLKELLRTDSRWVPDERGYSLYLRPTLMGTEEVLGVRASNEALLFTICSPVGPYFSSGFNAVSLYANVHEVRAWPGGVGDAKLGANYAPTIKPAEEAAKHGCQQVLWLIGENHQLMEVGAMNIFVYWINKQGKPELVTPALNGTILPGVTRDSILSLARSWGEFEVKEGTITMGEISEASDEGRLLEVFGSGTAAIVSPVKHILYLGKDIHVPLDPKNPKSQAGPLTKRFNETIMAIQYGEVPHEWSVVID